MDDDRVAEDGPMSRHIQMEADKGHHLEHFFQSQRMDTTNPGVLLSPGAS